jgi:hypothetical protein
MSSSPTCPLFAYRPICSCPYALRLSRQTDVGSDLPHREAIIQMKMDVLLVDLVWYALALPSHRTYRATDS